MIVIPSNPTSAGQLAVDLDLEWKGVTSRLKEALTLLRARNDGNAVQSFRPLADSSASSVRRPDPEVHRSSVPAAVQPVSADLLPEIRRATAAPPVSKDASAQSQHPIGNGAQAALVEHLISPSKQPQDLRGTTRPPSALPSALQAALGSAAHAPPKQPPAAQSHQVPQMWGDGQDGRTGQQSPAAAPIARPPSLWPDQISQQLWRTAQAPAKAAPASASAIEAESWTMVWRTDPMDNDGAAISSLVHVPSLPGLPGGDGHAGYLITAAGQLLNLYECSASGGRGEASLQIVHQLAADTEACMLAPDLGSCLLLASARDPGRPTRCLAMHSLSPETGLFAPQGRVPLPPIGSTFPSTAGSNQFKPQVTSLHELGVLLAGCCAASFGPSLVVYSTEIAPGEIPKPKAHWQAHSAPVSSLHSSDYGMQLWSGAQDGSMHAWDMRAKPSQPAVQARQWGAVTALRLVKEHCLQSGGADGRLCLWDVRRLQQPLHSLQTPDSGGITATALGPFGDPLVMGTTKGGLFSVNMASTSYSVTKCAKLEESISDVCWNMGTGEVFAASAASVVVVRQN